MGEVGEVLVAEELDGARDRAGGAVAERAERAAQDVVTLVEEEVEVGLLALAALERGTGATPMPVVAAPPPVTAVSLEPVARRARVALSRPVVLKGAGHRWRLSRGQVASMLALPRNGSRELELAGPGAAATSTTAA